MGFVISVIRASVGKGWVPIWVVVRLSTKLKTVLIRLLRCKLRYRIGYRIRGLGRYLRVVVVRIEMEMGIGVENTSSTVIVVSLLGQFVLVEHQVKLDCATKSVTLNTSDVKEIITVGERQDYLSNMFFAMVEEKLVQKVCEAFLSYVRDASVTGIFLEELLGLHLDCEVELGIKNDTGVHCSLFYSTERTQKVKGPTSRAFGRGFIRPDVASWGTLVLFVKKDGSVRLCIDSR
ncbi:Retrotransposon protein [Gossypium australe]|uniref:Retrotransposon protein n=1 Tax=Gossypium australe TaxID=47621 RepID=A0A5B6WE77_9ROSI|nr:Retrotransposon protein [Gossypium australe]